MKKILPLLITTGIVLTACNSGGSANPSNSTTPPLKQISPGTNSSINNSVPIIVDGGPTGQSPSNTPFVSVTICSTTSPSSCQTIDHIILDTGSMGLRLFANKVNINLNKETIGSSTVGECTLFGSGYDWGSIALANVQMGGETAQNVPIQIINDTSIPSIPSDCSNQGAYNDLGGANGIIGVNPLPYDNGSYYTCSGSSCTATSSITTSQEVVSPVYQFAQDNNGVIVQLPQAPSTGATSLTGTLTFGIGTQSNNQLTASNVFTSDGVEQDGSFTTTYDGGTYDSIFDTGTTEISFDTPNNTAALTTCSDNTDFYCPATTTTINTQLSSLNSSNGVNFSFNILNFDNFINNYPNSVVIPNSGVVGGGNFFIWGLPFFYGRKVFSAFSGASTSGGTGPYFAF